MSTDVDKEHSLLLTHHIKPDYGFYVTGDDRLYVAAYSSVASLVVRFSGYFLDARGTVNHYAIDVAPTADRAVTSGVAFLGEGFVLSCIATIITGSANRGQCYVRARIQRGAAANLVPVAQLLGGYVSDDYSPSFPYGRIEGPLDGPGMMRSITGTDPAAGIEVSETVPTGARWRLYMCRFTLVTDVTAANRVATLTLDDGAAIFFQTGSPGAIVASLTTPMSYASVGAEDITSGFSYNQMIPPSILLSAGFRIRSLTQSIQAADNYGAPQLLVEEWIEA